ncbi:MAG: hypothetical protein ACO23N_03120 [Opitutales bacterium]
MNFRPDVFLAAARGHCPACRERMPASPPWDIAPACDHCGLVLRRPGGFFLGALVWNYGLIAFGGIPVLTVLTYGLHWLTWKQAAWAGVVLGLSLPWLIHRLAWRLWIASYYAFLPELLEVDRRSDSRNRV